jgi:hypothetical protein
VSTQDTVVGLRALALFAAELAGSVDVSVAVNYGGSQLDFAVNQANFDLLQTWMPPSAAGDVSVSTSGSGMVLVSATVAYNAPEEEVEPVYTLEVEWTEKEGIWECGFSVIDDAERRLREAMPDMSEASGKKKPNAGMLLADIGVFTGFQTADVEAQLRASPGGSAVKRVEAGPYGNVIIYLDGEVEDLRFTAHEVFAVANRSPANSKVIDYYQPERMGASTVRFGPQPTTSPGPPPDAAEPAASAALAVGFGVLAVLGAL